ncbi:MAG: hemolysin family protein [Thermoanaerobaculum sp.]|nr:hemolysin family protein [Thermoanaerobaculum sp.]
MQALTQWWANPVTALLFTLLTGGAAFVLLAGLMGIVRLGNIKFVGLLSARRQVLPGVPRTFEAAAAAVVVLVGLVVGSWVALTAFAWRTLALAGVREGPSWVVVGVLWFSVVAAAARLTRGDRAELFAVASLVLLRPLGPVVSRVASGPEPPKPESGFPTEEDDGEVDEHEVRAFIGAGEEAGILEHEDAELVASIVELSETIAREIMTPRTDLVALPVDADFATVKGVFAASMFTRLPVYRQSLDHIEGVVHVKDVLKAVASDQAPAARELMRPVLVVPETKPLRDLLRVFQQSRQQLAVVVDEYGGTAGIVTLEDVIEEIVGEIEDEHQQQAPEVQAAGDGSYLIAGNAHVEVLADLFGLELEEDAAYDSVAGLVLDRLGRLPRPGETVEYRGLQFEVVEEERRRLKRMRVLPLAGSARP